MPKQKLVIPIPHVPPEEAQRLVRVADEATKKFQGNFEELESAIGMLILGRLVGWKVLVLIHNKRTIKKYEEILGINVREAFPPTAEFTRKSLGYEITQKLDAFWKAVSGEVPVDRRRELQRS